MIVCFVYVPQSKATSIIGLRGLVKKEKVAYLVENMSSLLHMIDHP